jgi:hypothetical protein
LDKNRKFPSLNRLNKTHRCIHIHGNNNEGYIPYTKGIPNVVECCYVLNKFSAEQVDYGVYPIDGLDFPCKLGFKDLDLLFWK